MEVDKGKGHLARLRSVNSLNSEELEAGMVAVPPNRHSRSLARERIFKLIYIQIDKDFSDDSDIPSAQSSPGPQSPYSFSFNFSSSNTTADQSVSIEGGITLPSTIYHVAEWILNYGRNTKILFDSASTGKDMLVEISQIGPNAFLKTFPPSRCNEVFQFLLQLLRSRPVIIPPSFHSPLKSKYCVLILQSYNFYI
ncbi:hypothetical protein HDU97_010329 [Phlyctochytrium planicorne]|nr:hypothetical protein HDU97_010329 [Phlyctochytrium planicorne]